MGERRAKKAACLAALLLALALSGCTQSPPECNLAIANSAPAWTKTELYFGLSKPGGGTVSAAEWQNFLDREITPHFPDGLTVLDADGQWNNNAGKLVREKSKVVVLFHPGTAANQQALQQICDKYKQLFQQEAVLRATTPASVKF
jgi:hypothetical protein